jgi:hypothetical protein
MPASTRSGVVKGWLPCLTSEAAQRWVGIADGSWAPRHGYRQNRTRDHQLGRVPARGPAVNKLWTRRGRLVASAFVLPPHLMM